MRETAAVLIRKTRTNELYRDDVTAVVFGLELRAMLVQEKYYIQPEQIQLQLLQKFVDSVCGVYQLPKHHVTNTHIVKNLFILKGATWANAVYAMASPYLYVENILPFSGAMYVPGVVQLPYRVVPATMPDLDTLIQQWAFALYMLVAQYPEADVMQYVADTIRTNDALVAAYNSALPSELHEALIHPVAQSVSEAQE